MQKCFMNQLTDIWLLLLLLLFCIIVIFIDLPRDRALPLTGIEPATLWIHNKRFPNILLFITLCRLRGKEREREEIDK